MIDKLSEYRNLIKQIMAEYIELANRQPKSGVESVFIADDERGHYLWIKPGWEGGRRIKHITVYVRLHEGKFWIEEDWTEDGIATDLVREGVPRQDIVLAFHDPETRKYTDFAIA